MTAKTRSKPAEVRDIMTQDPACATPGQTIQQAAQMMVACDCGAIPVVQDQESKKLVGIITDRDIACRAVAKGKPAATPVSECMSSPVATVMPDIAIEKCCEVMEEKLVRRIPVVDEQGACVGIVTQAHIAEKSGNKQTAEVVKQVSQKTEEPSRMAAAST